MINGDIASSIFAAAIGFMLRSCEGIIVKTLKGKFMVWRTNKDEIRISEYDGDEPSGRMVWVHDDDGIVDQEIIGHA